MSRSSRRGSRAATGATTRTSTAGSPTPWSREAGSGRPVIFVHDYHLALLPGLLRERSPDCHDRDVLAHSVAERRAGGPAAVPGRDSRRHARQRHRRIPDAGARAQLRRVRGRRTSTRPSIPASGSIGRPHGAVAVRAYPISVEWPSRWADAAPSVDDCRRSVRAELGIEADAPMMLSVDRLDYTKGIEERLAAIRRLLARGNATVGRPVFVQIAAPSRTRLERYRELGERVRAQVAAINARFGVGRLPPGRAHRPARRAAGGLPLLPRRRRLPRQQPGRRDEPGRQGIRRRARRRPGRRWSSASSPAPRRSSPARSSSTRTTSTASPTPWPWRLTMAYDDQARRMRGCAATWPITTSIAGPGGCCSMPRPCGNPRAPTSALG